MAEEGEVLGVPAIAGAGGPGETDDGSDIADLYGERRPQLFSG